MSSYVLGESRSETERLRAQAGVIPVDERARWAGLRAGMRVVDAGCGPGEVARTLARLTGPTGDVLGFDLSQERLDAARQQPHEDGSAPMRFVQGDLNEPPVAAGSVDFVFSQFVFEYLAQPGQALAALSRLVRPGGIVCVCDVDGIGGILWPEPPDVRDGLERMFRVMAPTGFDPYVGRKLYTLMIDAGLKDVEIRVDPMVTAGKAPPEEIANWQQRFHALRSFGAQAFGNLETYEAFVLRYMDVLSDGRTLKFTHLVSVRGMVT